ncbi:hypothetical protein LY78DRAFT_731611 [Colletotrichum sublineola]|nr:hypothetical protein LY78DRAFT_731611 [Colletotrichum sublineola]
MSPLSETLKLLNECGLQDFNDTVSKLWTQLRFDFDHADASITQNQTFAAWALRNVDRQTLCFAVDIEQRPAVQSMSSELRSRLGSVAGRFDASPALICWLLGIKLAKSRPTLKLLHDVKDATPDLTLFELYTRFDSITRRNHKGISRSANSILKEAIQSFLGLDGVADADDSGAAGTEAVKTADADADNVEAANSSAATIVPRPSKQPPGKPTQPPSKPAPRVSVLKRNPRPVLPKATRSQDPTEPRPSVEHAGSPEVARHAFTYTPPPPSSPLLGSDCHRHSPGVAADDEDSISMDLSSLYPDASLAELMQGDDDLKSDPLPSSQHPQRLRRPMSEDASVLLHSPKLKRRRLTTIGPGFRPSINSVVGFPVDVHSPLPSSPRTLDSLGLLHSKPVSLSAPPPTADSPVGASGNPIEVVDAEPTRPTHRRCNLELMLHGACTLAPGKWLNDVVVNTLIGRLASIGPAKNRQFTVVDSLQHHAKLTDRGRQAMLLDGLADVVLLPVEHNNHWVLFEWRCSTKQLKLYDSLSSDGSPRPSLVDQKLVPFLRWLHNSDQIPISFEKQNSFDCGVMAVLSAYRLAGYIKHFPTDPTANNARAERQYLQQCFFTSFDAALTPDEVLEFDLAGLLAETPSAAHARAACLAEFFRRQRLWRDLARPGKQLFRNVSDATIRDAHNEARQINAAFLAYAVANAQRGHGRLLADAVRIGKSHRKNEQLRDATSTILRHLGRQSPMTCIDGSEDEETRVRKAKVLDMLRSAAEVANDVVFTRTLLSTSGGPVGNSPTTNPYSYCVAMFLIARYAAHKFRQLQL